MERLWYHAELASWWAFTLRLYKHAETIIIIQLLGLRLLKNASCDNYQAPKHVVAKLAVHAVRLYKLLPRRSTCCTVSCVINVVSYCFSELFEEAAACMTKTSSDEAAKFSVHGRLVYFALSDWWWSTLAIATALGVFVCLCRRRTAASVLGHVLIFLQFQHGSVYTTV